MQVICVTASKYISPIATKQTYMAYVPAVLVTAGIAVLSLIEQEHAPRVGANDKLAHAVSYAVLGFCWMIPFKARITQTKSLILQSLCVVLACTAYGLLIEALQRFCTLTRSGEMADLMADFIGAVAGVLVWMLYWFISKSKSHV